MIIIALSSFRFLGWLHYYTWAKLMRLTPLTARYPVSVGNLPPVFTWKIAVRELAIGQECDSISLAQRWVRTRFPFPTYQWLHSLHSPPSTHPSLLCHTDPAQNHSSASPGQLSWVLRKQAWGSHLHANSPAHPATFTGFTVPVKTGAET